MNSTGTGTMVQYRGTVPLCGNWFAQTVNPLE